MNNSGKCLPISDLTPKQLESLSIVPGVLSNFDEKEKLPPTARAQWAYVQLNPTEYLDRFKSELDLLGVSVAICFINKDTYRDADKDLTTPITLNLIVHPDQFAAVQNHLVETKLSHKPSDDGKGFALPYLGSIQKMLDALSLEKLISYVFLENSISREAYFTWISVPKQYLAPKPEPTAPAKQAEPKGSNVESPNKDSRAERAALPSDSRKGAATKENFNYVIYDDTGETVPPIPIPAEKPKTASVVVAAGPKPGKQNFFGKLRSGFTRSQKQNEKREPATQSNCSIAKFDASLFLFLSLFNFYCSYILLAFLSKVIDGIKSVMLEAVTVSALAALLFAIFVIRPSFRNPINRVWSLGAYLGYFAVAGYQISRAFNSSEPGSYLIPTAIAIVCLVAALISAFMRIDRLSMKKGKTSSKGDIPLKQDVNDPEEVAVSADEAPAPASSTEAKRIPAPVRPKSKKDENKKIELKPSKTSDKTSTTSEPEVAAMEDTSTPGFPAQTEAKQTIPLKPITEAQKDTIRNRLNRKDLLVTPAPLAESVSASGNLSPKEQKPLSAAEIRARLAARLEQTRAVNTKLNGSETPGNIEANNSQQENKAGSSIKLRKPALESQDEASSDQEQQKKIDSGDAVKKLSLPNR